MNAMILAAGRGTRLGSLGQKTPKVLVDICGEPLLERQITYLKSGGIERVVVNVHHLADQVQAFVAENRRAAEVDVIVEKELLGTAGGVRNALSWLGDSFVVLYGDVVVDEPIPALVSTHREARAVATIAVYETTQIEGKGVVETFPDGTASEFREKAAASSGSGALVNAGLYLLESSIVCDLPPGLPLDFGSDVLPAALERQERIATHVLGEPVIDIGTPEGLRLARAACEPA
jgi:NDP-sugar pyrophosphorylase family protein